MNVAIMARVSTEEQARHGLSIDAQLYDLQKWAKEKGHIIVGEYVDAGISGKTPYNKRPALSRFMSDIQNGLKVDALVFTKLDRFYRSVKLYYQANEIMDKYNVRWKAIQEDYETVTASGRFKVNIMLAVAENEADRTSERIKTVFEHKVSKGEAISGMVPLGFMIKDKRLVHNQETVEMARDFFHHYKETGSMHGTAKYMYSTYGFSIDYHMVRRMLRNPLYKGEYRDNRQFCEPIISSDEFDEIQKMLSDRSIRCNPTGRVYLFSGLLTCSLCNRSMTAFCRVRASGQTDVYYRCNHAVQYHRCTHHKMIDEKIIEKWLLENLYLEIEKLQDEWSVTEKKQPKKQITDISTIQHKLDRLKDLYIEDLISKEQYKADREKFLGQIEEINSAQIVEPPDFEEIKKKISSINFANNYQNMSRSQKQSLWRSIIARIYFDAENTPRVVFK